MTIAFDPTLVSFDPPPVYRTSSLCTGGGCVEVAPLPGGGAAVRNTKDRGREPLIFDNQEWEDFVLGVKNGEFDFENISSFQCAAREEN